MTQNVKKAPRSSRTSHAWAALLLLGLATVLASAGCGSDCKGDDCKPCLDSECAEGQRCVQNECRSACTSDASCPGLQRCRYKFYEGDQRYCVILPDTVIPNGGSGPGAGRFSACDSDTECDQEHGFSCMEGECNYPCRSHADCAGVGHCESRLVDGQRQTYCTPDETLPEPGGLYTACPNGDECNDAKLCVGAGAGDLDAYCTVDCTRDDDCLAGYYCGNLTRPPCEDACPVQGEPTFAGQPTNPRCVPSEQIGDDQPYQCGDLGIVRSVCRQREFCSPCQSDADCLAVPNQVCARDASGEKICTRLCESGTRSCPWGNAGTCDVFDTELGQATCSHRFGSCHGAGETCEPCTTDAHCPGGVCASSQFTGERWCINFGTRCSCENVDATGTCNDGGCPDSPSGLSVLCIGEPTSDLFNTCYSANASGGSLLGDSPQTGCWDAN